jgi:two-component system osmolarity sensor histidine kinase EnvZ
VSHDLRTVLTRFKLELAFLGDSAHVRDLKRDVDEMQRMLEDYMAFVKGDGGESAEECDLRPLLEAVRHSAEREGRSIEIRAPEALRARVKPDAFRRCVANLVGNAMRFGQRVMLSAERSEHHVAVAIEDDGPGIPLDKRGDVFRPFVRLDHARNQDQSGTGLGLSIALDIARSHGGDVSLDDSALGGLRATVRVPV